ncbi:MAG: aminotransferase DegT, partial [Clostridiales bacterium]|nr:aminotransferase DegT [Clostridiales bacterium]
IYAEYKKAFADVPEITMNPMNPKGHANNWLSCMTISTDCKVSPYDIMGKLSDANIESRLIWKPMHLQPVYEKCDYITANGTRQNPVNDAGSVCEDIFNRGLCLPSDIKNTEEDMQEIIGIVKNCF